VNEKTCTETLETLEAACAVMDMRQPFQCNM